MRPWTSAVNNEHCGAMEKRLLQLAILVGGIVPVSAGLEGALRGTRFLGAWPGRGADSHFRYMSGLLLGIGLVLWGCIPTIERRTTIVRSLTLIVVIGGLSRLYGWIAVGDPGKIRWALVMELGVTPLICLWQTRIARRSGKA
jgi:hypothetical protein